MANHTTPIDVIILANDGCYSMVEHSVCLCMFLCEFNSLFIRMNDYEKLLWCFVFFCIKVCRENCCFPAENNSLNLCWTCLSGRPGAWRVDGNDPKSHGQIHSSHLVWKIRSQRQTPSGQKVTLPHLAVISLSSCYIMVSTTAEQPIIIKHECPWALYAWPDTHSKEIISLCHIIMRYFEEKHFKNSKLCM